MAGVRTSRDRTSGRERPRGKPPVHLSRFEALAFRGLAQRKARTGLTLLAIALGVAVMLAVDVAQATTLASLRALFDEISGSAHLIVQPAAVGSRGFEEETLQALLDVEGIEAVAPLVRVQTSLVGETTVRDSPFLPGPQGGVTVLGVDPGMEAGVREYALSEGRALAASHEQAALIGEELAETQGLGAGDEVHLVAAAGEFTLPVAGVLERLGVGRLNNGQVVVAPLPLVQDAFQLSGQLTEIDVVIDPAIAGDARSLDSFKADLDDQLSAGVDVAYPASRGRFVSRTLSAYQTSLDSFGVVAMFVGGFLIYNAFAMTIVERIREIGMLRAIGGTRRQIVRLILGEALVLGLAGGLIGLACGLALAGVLIRGMSYLLSAPLDTLSIPPGSLARSFGAGLVVTLLAAVLPARQGSQILPLQALRIRAQAGEPGRGRSWRWAPGIVLFALSNVAILFVEALPRAMRVAVHIVSVLGLFLGAALLVSPVLALLAPALRRALIPVFGAAGWIGGSNVVRARSRSALTAAALMIGVTMVIAFGEQVNSVRADVLSWVDGALGGDVYVRSVHPMRPGLGADLLQTPGVQAVTPTTFGTTSLVTPSEGGQSSPVSVRAIDPETYGQAGTFKFDDPPGDPAARVADLGEGGAVFVATTLADRYGIQRSDRITMETNQGPRRFRVVGIIVDFNAQGNTITMDRRNLERYFGLRRVHMFTVVAAPQENAAALTEEIERRYGESEQVAVHSRASLKERLNGLMDQQSALLYALVGIALVVGSAGVVNTLMMNVMERRREIGMLLSLGMTRRQILKVVLAESASMGLVGTSLGLALGLLVSHALVKGANVVTGYRFGYTFSTSPLFFGLAIGLLLSQLAGLYPAYRATQTNIVEAIKHE